MDGIYSYKRFIDPKSTDFKQNFILGYVRAQSELTFQTKPSGPSLVNGSGDAEDGVLPPIEVQNETGQTIVMGSYVDDIEVNSSATQIKPEGKKKMLDGMVQTDLASSKRTKASHLSRRNDHKGNREYSTHHKAKSQAKIQNKTIKYDFDEDTSFLKPEPPTVIDSSSVNEETFDHASQKKKQPMKAGKSTVKQVSSVPDPSPEAPSLSKIRDAVRQQRADTKRARASIQKKAEPAKEAKKWQKSKKSAAAGKSGSVEIMTKFLSDKIGSGRVTIKPTFGIYNKGKRSEKIQVSEGVGDLVFSESRFFEDLGSTRKQVQSKSQSNKNKPILPSKTHNSIQSKYFAEESPANDDDDYAYEAPPDNDSNIFPVKSSGNHSPQSKDRNAYPRNSPESHHSAYSLAQRQRKLQSTKQTRPASKSPQQSSIQDTGNVAGPEPTRETIVVEAKIDRRRLRERRRKIVLESSDTEIETSRKPSSDKSRREISRSDIERTEVVDDADAVKIKNASAGEDSIPKKSNLCNSPKISADQKSIIKASSEKQSCIQTGSKRRKETPTTTEATGSDPKDGVEDDESPAKKSRVSKDSRDTVDRLLQEVDQLIEDPTLLWVQGSPRKLQNSSRPTNDKMNTGDTSKIVGVQSRKPRNPFFRTLAMVDIPSYYDEDTTTVDDLLRLSHHNYYPDSQDHPYPPRPCRTPSFHNELAFPNSRVDLTYEDFKSPVVSQVVAPAYKEIIEISDSDEVREILELKDDSQSHTLPLPLPLDRVHHVGHRGRSYSVENDYELDEMNLLSDEIEADLRAGLQEMVEGREIGYGLQSEVGNRVGLGVGLGLTGGGISRGLQLEPGVRLGLTGHDVTVGINSGFRGLTSQSGVSINGVETPRFNFRPHRLH